MNRMVQIGLAIGGGVLALIFVAYIFWPAAGVAPVNNNIYKPPSKILTIPQTYEPNPVTRYAPPDSDPKPPPTTKMTLALATGKGIIVHDIVHDSTTVTDPTVPNRYFLTGGLEPVSNDFPYSIYYSSVDQSFTVVLYQEPFQTTRSDAERDLLNKLGIDQNTACNLRYQVVVPSWASADYSNKNLGFSFCPGSSVFSN